MTINIEELLKHKTALTFNARQSLIISILHYNGIINDEKMKAMLKNVCKHQNKFHNVYHCRINNKWYNKMYKYNILQDVLNTMDVPLKSMEFSELQPYVELFIRKGWNKSLNYVVNNMIMTYFNAIININNYTNDKEVNNIFKAFNLPILAKIDTIDYSAHYCCKQCDGDRDKYITSRKEKYINILFKQVRLYYYKEVRNLWKRKKRHLVKEIV